MLLATRARRRPWPRSPWHGRAAAPRRCLAAAAAAARLLPCPGTQRTQALPTHQPLTAPPSDVPLPSACPLLNRPKQVNDSWTSLEAGEDPKVPGAIQHNEAAAGEVGRWWWGSRARLHCTARHCRQLQRHASCRCLQTAPRQAVPLLRFPAPGACVLTACPQPAVSPPWLHQLRHREMYRSEPEEGGFKEPGQDIASGGAPCDRTGTQAHLPCTRKPVSWHLPGAWGPDPLAPARGGGCSAARAPGRYRRLRLE